MAAEDTGLELFLEVAEVKLREASLEEEEKEEAQARARRMRLDDFLKAVSKQLPSEIAKYIYLRGTPDENLGKLDVPGIQNVIEIRAPRCVPVYIHIDGWKVKPGGLDFYIPALVLSDDALVLSAACLPKDISSVFEGPVFSVPTKQVQEWALTKDVMLAMAEARLRWRYMVSYRGNPKTILKTGRRVDNDELVAGLRRLTMPRRG